MRSLELAFPPRQGERCEIHVGDAALSRLVDDLGSDPRPHRVVLVSDSNVTPLHAAPLLETLRRRGVRAELLTFAAGEENKTRATKAYLEDRLLGLGAGRDTVMIAVGGGVTGDLAGFVAATWHRGVAMIQVPTSLLAMVDAAIGGKTAVDLPGAKNVVGAFHQPAAIYVEPAVLDTLPEREFRNGLAEAIKSAVIADVRLFHWLERNVDAVVARDRAALERVVLRCIAIKSRIVVDDEREVGRRAALNFGHTVGHALEASTGYRIRHGEAVAIGMVAEARIAERRTAFPKADVVRLIGLLDRFGLPVTPAIDVNPEAVLAAAGRDKKSRAGTIRCALPVALGRMPAGDEVTVAVEPSEIGAALRESADA